MRNLSFQMGQKATRKAFLQYYCASDPCLGLILCRNFVNDCDAEKRKVLILAADDTKRCQIPEEDLNISP